MATETPRADAPDPVAEDRDGLVYHGEPLKVLRSYKADGREYATLGGYLVVFTDAKSPDLTGDFFDARTDFGTLSRKGRAEVPGYYQHGFDAHFKGEAIGDAELSADDFGVWAEYQIELRTDYERHIVDMAGKGLMGQSSGAVGHLVEREPVTDAVYRIKRWPIGEASLTPTPAEPKTSAVPLKAFKAWAEQQGALTEPAPEATEAKGEPTDSAREGTQEDHQPAAQPQTEMADNATKTAEEAVENETQETAVKADAPETKSEPSRLITLDDARRLIDEEVKARIEDGKPTTQAMYNTKSGPAFIRETGDDEAKAFSAWLRSGDVGGVKHLMSVDEGGQQIVTIGANPHDGALEGRKSIKASNDTDMNIGTAADGGNAVPTGHFNQIIARRDESMLSGMLGCRNIPGVGTTVNVPLDAEDDGEFVATSEAASSDRDAPALGQKALTLATYTKYLDLSYELLRDEASNVLSFISEWVGRGMAKTHNALLLAEVLANGTEFKEFAAAAIADGDLEGIEGNDNLGAYLDDASVAWVMRNSTLSAIRQISGNDRVYAARSTEDRSVQGGRELIGYPVYRSNKADAIGADNTSVYFGNWYYVGYRAPDGLQFLRDPYSKAVNRQVRMHYYFSAVYGVLQSEAIGYGQHAAS